MDFVSYSMLLGNAVDTGIDTCTVQKFLTNDLDRLLWFLLRLCSYGGTNCSCLRWSKRV